MRRASSLVKNLVVGHEGNLIAILGAIQERYHYLPEDTLRQLAISLGIPLRDVYGLATFYKSFQLEPRGNHLISVCVGTACHVRGAPSIAAEFTRQLGIGPGETTRDNEFTFETVNCLGACALGPMVVVDGKYFSNVKRTQVKNILDTALSGFDKANIKADERIFPVQVNCPRCNHSLMDAEYPIDGYPSIRVTISFGRKHGWHRLSSLYGSHHFRSEHRRTLGVVAHYFCPHCHAELIGSAECPECGTTMVPMIVRGGGIAQICPRRGCKGHLLDV
jgi:NADH:ubiquinone oxidoreductase subunit E